MNKRTATIHRVTLETEIQVTLNLDGTGDGRMETGVGFLDHMLEQLSRHGLFDLSVLARGDNRIDDHHTVEDIGIVVGQAFRQALGERRGIVRFGTAHVPLDETLVRVVVDLSNRAHLHWDMKFPTEKVGSFDTELFREWYVAFANNSASTLHVSCLHGINSHHMAEASFKALGRALRQACSIDGRLADLIPSTKGTLS
ncbi:MAG: imidazoleglycerol-phosphate dehydratase HisB [Magnetococcales bacterium]|nr:imidazoleglycerol-phosphate dehydratase HisB [Magnetococcales bacterium]NGZ28849.1 imidazoleglycerol-phosphate dehydratase HisB [Magnetococcales bacterium]